MKHVFEAFDDRWKMLTRESCDNGRRERSVRQTNNKQNEKQQTK